MPKTPAEEQFERLCDLRRLRWRRIRIALKEDHKRPDYAVWVGEAACVVEVKQLGLNEEDRKQLKELDEAGHTCGERKEPGRRLGAKITEAADQLRSFRRRGIAGVLVLSDDLLPLPYLLPHRVMAGMYGRLKLEVVLGEAPSGRWSASRLVSGGGEKMTPNTNTSVSALAHLQRGSDREPYLILYHNEYAAVPLDASCVARVTDHQFEVRRLAGRNVWVQAITGDVLEDPRQLYVW